MTDTVVSGHGVSQHRPAAHSRGDAAPAAPGTPGREVPRRAPGVLLAIVLTAQFMALLDTSIVNVGIPTIQASLHASGASPQISDETVKIASPVRNTRRWPRMSPRRAPVTSSTA